MCDTKPYYLCHQMFEQLPFRTISVKTEIPYKRLFWLNDMPNFGQFTPQNIPAEWCHSSMTVPPVSCWQFKSTWFLCIFIGGRMLSWIEVEVDLSWHKNRGQIHYCWLYSANSYRPLQYLLPIKLSILVLKLRYEIMNLCENAKRCFYAHYGMGEMQNCYYNDDLSNSSSHITISYIPS